MALGIDPFLGGESCYKLSDSLGSYLYDLGITRLAIYRSVEVNFNDCNYWYYAYELGLTSYLALE